MAETLKDTSLNGTPRKRVSYGGSTFDIPGGLDKDQMKEVMGKIMKTPAFVESLDRTTGASTLVRTAAHKNLSKEDRLATIRKTYPDAQEYEDNYVFTHPETGKPTLVNETEGGLFDSGISTGDVTQYGRDIAQVFGAGVGGALTMPGAFVTGGNSVLLGGALGSQAAGTAYDILVENLLGTQNTETGVERVVKAGVGTSLEFAGGKAVEKVVSAVSPFVKKVLGGGTDQAAKIYKLMVNQKITPTPGIVTDGGIGRLEASLSSAVTSATIMRKQATKVTKEAEAAADNLANKVGTPSTQQELGETIQDSVVRAQNTFNEAQTKAEDALEKAIGPETLFDLKNIAKFRGELEREISKDSSLKNLYGGMLKTLDDVLMNNGKMEYGALRNNRTITGKNLSNVSDTGTQKNLFNRFYAATSKDIEENAGRLGHGQHFKEVSDLTKDWMNKNGKYFKKIAEFDAPEKAYGALLNGTKNGGSYIKLLRDEFTEKEWQPIQATVLKKMGFKGLGNESEFGFSPSTFVTNYNNFSVEAKDAFFGSNNSLRKELDNLMTVFTAMAQQKSLQNFSNTAAVAHQLNALSKLGDGLGNVALGIGTASPLAAAKGVGNIVSSMNLAPNLAARLITSPKFVKWLATPMAKGSNAGAKLGQLIVIANENPETAEAIKAYLLAFSPQTGKIKEKE